MTLSTPTLTFPDLHEFLAACAARGLTAAVVRSVDEPRARTHGSGVTVGHVREVTLLAYDRGEVLRCVIPDPPDDLTARLGDAGLRLRAVVDRTY
jgi:hypothetical protein